MQTLGNHTKERIRSLRIDPTIAIRCRISRCEVFIVRKWRIASRRHLLQICCPPSVLVSSVQGLTDHLCCAAGSSKNQNHNSEEHLDAWSAFGSVAEIWVQLICSGTIFTNLSPCVSTLNDKVSELWRLILRYAHFLIFGILSPSLTLAVSYELQISTSHLLSFMLLEGSLRGSW